MDDARKWSLAVARFNAFRDDPPRWLDDDAVAQFHETVTALEQASGDDLSLFRIPDNQMRRQVISSRPRRARPGRPPSGGKRMSEKRYCDDKFMRRQIEGIVSYFHSLQLSTEPRKIGFLRIFKASISK
jgi:hypothetical protein